MSLSAVVLVGLLVIAAAFVPNVQVDETNNLLYINKNDDFKAVKKSLYAANAIRVKASFEVAAQIKRYPGHVKPGRYELNNNMGNFALINKLRSGDQDALQLSFSNVNTLEQFAGKMGQQLMADSLAFLKLLSDPNVINKLGFTPETFMAMFIPNTYEVYWTEEPQALITRLKSEYDKFWNKRRRQQAKQIGLTPIEVSILASIVEKETYIDKENPIVAGVYMNRLKKRMRLSADPTVIFALNDFSIRRVLKRHLKVNSPYNTYKHYGLPPGPICSPSISAIDGVLNYERHKYLYFCASPEFNMEHVFASNYRQHLRNAKRFHRALNARGIR